MVYHFVPHPAPPPPYHRLLSLVKAKEPLYANDYARATPTTFLRNYRRQQVCPFPFFFFLYYPVPLEPCYCAFSPHPVIRKGFCLYGSSLGSSYGAPPLFSLRTRGNQSGPPLITPTPEDLVVGQILLPC